VPLFLNARTVIYLGQFSEPDSWRAHTLERLRAFVDSGVDGSGAMRAVYGRLRPMATELQGPGTFETFAEGTIPGGGSIPYVEMQGLMPG
jgi:hypothetical protein